MSVVSIIIPTWNNPQYLYPCLTSIAKHTGPEDLYHIYVVNNGSPESVEPLKQFPNCTVLQQERNMGWEGGLKAGLAASNEPYVIFMNDDTFVPWNQRYWISRMLNYLADPNCGAVGPSSNVVMGKQNMFLPIYESHVRTKFLIGFCMAIKRSTLEEVGGVDDALPGGDDLDLSIRLRKAGKYLVADREILIYHYGFKTGERVAGGPNVEGGWNSIQRVEQTNFALINKHGLRWYLDLWAEEASPATMIPHNWGDNENKLVTEWTLGPKVAELGCGDKKLFADSVGIDIVPRGTEIGGLSKGRFSLADVTANIEEELPVKDFDTIIAQHVLEHTVDAMGATMAWRKALRTGGRLIIAVPDQTYRNTIPLNWEHRHAWTPASLKRFMEAQGWKTVDMLDPENRVSFIGIFEANGEH